MPPMTTLPAGTYIRFRYRGEWDYAQIMPDRNSYKLLAETQIPLTAEIHECVWKGKAGGGHERLESRRVITGVSRARLKIRSRS